MKHADFTIGGTFWFGGRRFPCPDIGPPVIAAVPYDSLALVRAERSGKDPLAPATPKVSHILTWEEAEAEGHFNAPPTPS